MLDRSKGIYHLLNDESATNPPNRGRRAIGIVVLVSFVLAIGFGSVIYSMAGECNATSASNVRKGQHLQQFSRFKMYESLDKDQDHLWDEILPTQGFVQLEREEVFGIALFHQVRKS